MPLAKEQELPNINNLEQSGKIPQEQISESESKAIEAIEKKIEQGALKKETETLEIEKPAEIKEKLLTEKELIHGRPLEVLEDELIQLISDSSSVEDPVIDQKLVEISDKFSNLDINDDAVAKQILSIVEKAEKKIPHISPWLQQELNNRVTEIRKIRPIM